MLGVFTPFLSAGGVEGRGASRVPTQPPFCPLRAAGPHATPPGKREGGNCTREIEGLSEGREGGGDPRKGSGKASCELNSPLGRAGTRATVMRGRQEAALSLRRPLLCCVRGPLRPRCPFLLSGPRARTAPGWRCDRARAVRLTGCTAFEHVLLRPPRASHGEHGHPRAPGSA